jgi:hypothetical protein
MTSDERKSYETALAFVFIRVATEIVQRPDLQSLRDAIISNGLEFKNFLLKEVKEFFSTEQIYKTNEEFISPDQSPLEPVIFVFNEVYEEIKTEANIQYLYGEEVERAAPFESYLLEKAKSFLSTVSLMDRVRASNGGCC